MRLARYSSLRKELDVSRFVSCSYGSNRNVLLYIKLTRKYSMHSTIVLLVELPQSDLSRLSEFLKNSDDRDYASVWVFRMLYKSECFACLSSPCSHSAFVFSNETLSSLGQRATMAGTARATIQDRVDASTRTQS